MPPSTSECALGANGIADAAAPKRADRFSSLHLALQSALALLFAYALELDRIFHLWLALVPLIGIPAIVVALTWTVSVISNSCNKRWRRLVSTLAAPIIVLSASALLAWLEIDPHWIRFQINKREYRETLSILNATHPRNHTWNWGEAGGAAVRNVFWTLEYDESDRSPLKAVLRGDGDEGPSVSVRSFGNHFYLVTRMYP